MVVSMLGRLAHLVGSGLRSDRSWRGVGVCLERGRVGVGVASCERVGWGVGLVVDLAAGAVTVTTLTKGFGCA
jgi:hypothetical protein